MVLSLRATVDLMPDHPTEDFRAYTVLTAKLLGIHLEEDEIEPVTEQVARVASLVEQLDRIDDDDITPAPRFRAGARPDAEAEAEAR